jgi:hypothetical protein
MLWSQFSAIFANFRRNYWRFWLCQQCDSIMPTVWLDCGNSVTWLWRQCDLIVPTVWLDCADSVTWLCRQCDLIVLTVWLDCADSVTWLCRQCDLIVPTVWLDFANSVTRFCQQCDSIVPTVYAIVPTVWLDCANSETWLCEIPTFRKLFLTLKHRMTKFCIQFWPYLQWPKQYIVESSPEYLILGDLCREQFGHFFNVVTLVANRVTRCVCEKVAQSILCAN